MEDIERLKAWKKENPDRIKEGAAKYRRVHREEINRKGKKYAAARVFTEEERQYRRVKAKERYHKNKEAIRNRKKELMTPEKLEKEKEQNRKWKAAHPEKRRLYNSKRTRFIISLKEGKTCVVCGEQRHYVLDWHHINGKLDKKFTIGNTAGPRDIQVILDEVAKCALVCANCHRAYNWEQRNLLEGERTIKIGNTV